MTIADTMYTLGQLARAVYPHGDIPEKVLDALLTRPVSGLAMLANSAPASALRKTVDRHGDYDKLITSLPADITNGPVPIAEQGPFWTGWYHYMTGIERARNLGPKQLIRCGTLLFGERWQTDLAKALGVADRTVRAWVAGTRKPSAGVWADIAALLRQRSNEGLALLKEIDKPSSDPQSTIH